MALEPLQQAFFSSCQELFFGLEVLDTETYSSYYGHPYGLRADKHLDLRLGSGI